MTSPLNDSEPNEVECERQMADYKKHMELFKPPVAVVHPVSGLTNRNIGLGGAPTRATTLPDSPEERKRHPVASGVLDYFPDAIVAIAKVSQVGNDQHNPGQPLNWARGKSADEADTMIRHFLQRGSRDKDGLRHTAKMAWRALALLQKEIESEQKSIQFNPLAHEQTR